MKSDQATLAIDPGWSGACAVSYGDDVIVYRCPSTITEIIDLAHEIKDASEGTIFALLEKVHSMPGQGVKSVWTFSQNFTAWQCALYSAKIPYKEVRPNEWMNKLGGVPTGRDNKKERKNYIKSEMQKRYPDLKVINDTADALGLLTVYLDGGLG